MKAKLTHKNPKARAAGRTEGSQQRVVGRMAEYLYLVAAKKTHSKCKSLIPWERVNTATRTGFRRLARWAINHGIKNPSNEKS